MDRKLPESDTVTSFYQKPEDGEALPSFQPGQFLTFKLYIEDQPRPVIRTYSLSDSPGHKDYYRVSIKREAAPEPGLPAGIASTHFHDRVEVGARLSVKAPRGQFYLDPGTDTSVVLLSAGVGLTPMISMLNAIADSGSQRDTWYVHGARNGREHAMG
ncbi:MAG: oxidoreductase, partial [bacterium]|nr:oxidoreductase [bacterium]